MTYEIYRYIFIGSIIIAIAMLILAVILFFKFKIPVVIGDLTGANAKKAIEQIRNNNEQTGDKAYKSSLVNKERGRITEKISGSGNLIGNNTGNFGVSMQTEKIATTKLTELNQLELANETVVLSDNLNETTVLVENTNFCIEYDITLIHTQELIE